MVAAQTGESQASVSDSTSLPRGGRRGGVRRLLASSMRLTGVHYRIALLRAKMTAVRVAIFTGLTAGAIVLSLLGLIFLYISVFRLLTDTIGIPAWCTFLIYSVGHLAIAFALLMIGARTIRGRDEAKQEGDIRT